MATIKSEYYRFNGVSWDLHYFKTTMDMVVGLDTALAGKLDKRTGIVQSSSFEPDTKALFPYALTTASTAIGMEYNILLYAWKKGYTITQSGSGQIASPNGLFDGKLEPQYSPDGIDPNDPYVLTISGLPNIHTQTGGMIGWTARYWFPIRYKIEVFDSYNAVGWKTLVDQSSTPASTKDLVIPIFPTFSGAFTQIRITIYESGGSVGTNGFKRWGLSEIIFIHPEAQAVHQFLDVEWAKKLSTARQINGVNFDGSANIAVPSTDVKTWAKDGLVESASGNLNDLIQTGFYQGSSLTNAPTTGWYFYIVSRYRADSNWLSQMAISFGSGNTGNRTYTRSKISGTWSPWVELHNTSNLPLALTNSNQNLEMGSATQYIRLAYGPTTRAFIKHGGGAEHELYHSGSSSIVVPQLFVNNISSDGSNIQFTGIDYVSFDDAVLKNISAPFDGTDAANKAYVDGKGLGDLNGVTINAPQTTHGIVWNGTNWVNGLIGKAFVGLGFVENYGIATQAEAEAGTASNKYMTPLTTEQAIRKRSVPPVITKTGSATLALTDENDFIYVNSSSALTFTIPPNSSVAFPVGTEIHFMRYGTGEVSIAPGSGVSLLSEGTKRRINLQYQVVTIKKLLTDTWALFGALKT